MTLALPSVQSLFLTAAARENISGTATGFVVMYEGQPYLITNWHVVSGRNPADGQPIDRWAATPDTLHVRHLLPYVPGSNQLNWQDFDESLYDDETPRWLEHPVHQRKVDAVALPLTNASNARLIPYELTIPPAGQLKAVVSDFVNIVGFPFGVTAGGSFGIWTKGAIASEPDVNFNDLPCFLIDARTRKGQSGSPVIAFATGNATMANGFISVIHPPGLSNLLGVYSGRINDESDLGMVLPPAGIRLQGRTGEFKNATASVWLRWGFSLSPSARTDPNPNPEGGRRASAARGIGTAEKYRNTGRRSVDAWPAVDGRLPRPPRSSSPPPPWPFPPR